MMFSFMNFRATDINDTIIEISIFNDKELNILLQKSVNELITEFNQYNNDKTNLFVLRRDTTNDEILYFRIDIYNKNNKRLIWTKDIINISLWNIIFLKKALDTKTSINDTLSIIHFLNKTNIDSSIKLNRNMPHLIHVVLIYKIIHDLMNTQNINSDAYQAEQMAILNLSNEMKYIISKLQDLIISKKEELTILVQEAEKLSDDISTQCDKASEEIENHLNNNGNTISILNEQIATQNTKLQTKEKKLQNLHTTKIDAMESIYQTDTMIVYQYLLLQKKKAKLKQIQNNQIIAIEHIVMQDQKNLELYYNTISKLRNLFNQFYQFINNIAIDLLSDAVNATQNDTQNKILFKNAFAHFQISKNLSFLNEYIGRIKCLKNIKQIQQELLHLIQSPILTIPQKISQTMSNQELDNIINEPIRKLKQETKITITELKEMMNVTIKIINNEYQISIDKLHKIKNLPIEQQNEIIEPIIKELQQIIKIPIIELQKVQNNVIGICKNIYELNVPELTKKTKIIENHLPKVFNDIYETINNESDNVPIKEFLNITNFLIKYCIHSANLPDITSEKKEKIQIIINELEQIMEIKKEELKLIVDTIIQDPTRIIQISEEDLQLLRTYYQYITQLKNNLQNVYDKLHTNAQGLLSQQQKALSVSKQLGENFQKMKPFILLNDQFENIKALTDLRDMQTEISKIIQSSMLMSPLERLRNVMSSKAEFLQDILIEIQSKSQVSNEKDKQLHKIPNRQIAQSIFTEQDLEIHKLQAQMENLINKTILLDTPQDIINQQKEIQRLIFQVHIRQLIEIPYLENIIHYYLTNNIDVTDVIYFQTALQIETNDKSILQIVASAIQNGEHGDYVDDINSLDKKQTDDKEQKDNYTIITGCDTKNDHQVLSNINTMINVGNSDNLRQQTIQLLERDISLLENNLSGFCDKYHNNQKLNNEEINEEILLNKEQSEITTKLIGLNNMKDEILQQNNKIHQLFDDLKSLKINIANLKTTIKSFYTKEISNGKTDINDLFNESELFDAKIGTIREIMNNNNQIKINITVDTTLLDIETLNLTIKNINKCLSDTSVIQTSNQDIQNVIKNLLLRATILFKLISYFSSTCDNTDAKCLIFTAIQAVILVKKLNIKDYNYVAQYLDLHCINSYIKQINDLSYFDKNTIESNETKQRILDSLEDHNKKIVTSDDEKESVIDLLKELGDYLPNLKQIRSNVIANNIELIKAKNDQSSEETLQSNTSSKEEIIQEPECVKLETKITTSNHEPKVDEVNPNQEPKIVEIQQSNIPDTSVILEVKRPTTVDVATLREISINEPVKPMGESEIQEIKNVELNITEESREEKKTTEQTNLDPQSPKEFKPININVQNINAQSDDQKTNQNENQPIDVNKLLPINHINNRITLISLSTTKKTNFKTLNRTFSQLDLIINIAVNTITSLCINYFIDSLNIYCI